MSGILALYPDAHWLQGGEGELSWQRVTPDGAVVDEGKIKIAATSADEGDGFDARGVASGDLPQPHADEDIVVVIPAQLVVVLTVVLPPGKKRRLLPALPYLVEDELAVAVESLHFALLDPSANGTVQCAVVERRIVASLLERLRTAQLSPTAVIPDSWLLPVTNGAVTVMARDGMVLAKNALGKSCAVDDVNGEIVLAALCEDQVTDTLVLINPEDEGRWRLSAAGGGIKNIEVREVDNPLTLLSAQLPSSMTAANLLQGEFAPSARQTGAARWRNIAAAMALLVGLQLIYFVSAGAYFAYRATALEQQVEARYREIFPSDKKIVDVRSQAEGHLRNAAASGVAGFMEQVQMLARAWQAFASESFTLRGLRYDGRESTLHVDIDAASIQRVEALVTALNKFGSGARLQSARGENAGVRANLVIGGKDE